ncbi:MAG: ABC transporter permease [Gammaproteobacteria bacterium]|nr:ABC transporter permease [Gammaproteobacteria bacterium]
MNPNANHESLPLEMFKSAFKNRSLIFQMTKREVIGRYRGSMLGIAWSFFNPLIMLAVYTIVFSTVFKAKWGVGSDSKTEFALVLFIGIIVHGVLAESMSNSPSLMLRNASYVKKIIFPLEILPLVVMGSTLFHALISVVVWSVFYSIVNHSLNWTVIFLPLIFVPLILFSLGVSWVLASLGVYIRDIGQMTGVLITILLFLSPIFYPATALPEPYQTIIYLNPLTFVIEQAREVLMWGNIPNWTGLIVAYIVSILVAWAGFAWFQKTRQGFSDVL